MAEKRGESKGGVWGRKWHEIGIQGMAPPLLKTVIPLPDRNERRTSGGVEQQRVTGKLVAFAEQFIDLVNIPPAVAGWIAPPERRFETGLLNHLRIEPHRRGRRQIGRASCRERV